MNLVEAVISIKQLTRHITMTTFQQHSALKIILAFKNIPAAMAMPAGHI